MKALVDFKVRTPKGNKLEGSGMPVSLAIEMLFYQCTSTEKEKVINKLKELKE